LATRLTRELPSPPSIVRCLQLNRTLLRKSNVPPVPMLGFRPVLQAKRLWWNEHPCPPQVPPKAWLLRSRPSLEIDHWIVIFSTGRFSAGPPGTSTMCR
jgi:hypothetical protein